MLLRALLLVVLVLSPLAASAQGLAGPFGGLFGRTPERIGKEFTALEFRSALAGQYDDGLASEQPAAGLDSRGALTSGVNAGLSFERRSARLQLSAHGTGTRQQFFRTPAFGATSYQGGGLVMAKVATRLSLEGSATYSRSPFFNLLPALSGDLPVPEVPLPSDPFAVRRLDSATTEGTAGFTSPYTRRSTVSASVSTRKTRFVDQPDNDFELWGARGTWTRKLTRDVAARIGYGREEIQQSAGGERYVHEVFDVGVDLARNISLGRRTTFSFSTQPSMVRETGGERRYRLNGSIGLMRAFQRTWTASLAATRNTEFLPGFVAPVFSDGVNGMLAGLIGDRVEWSSAVAASRGRVGFEGTDDYVSYVATSRVSTGLLRHLGIFAEYAYYHYTLPAGSTTIVLLPQVSRQTVSVGFSAYVPIFSRVRTSRDPG